MIFYKSVILLLQPGKIKIQIISAVCPVDDFIMIVKIFNGDEPLMWIVRKVFDFAECFNFGIDAIVEIGVPNGADGKQNKDDEDGKVEKEALEAETGKAAKDGGGLGCRSRFGCGWWGW